MLSCFLSSKLRMFGLWNLLLIHLEIYPKNHWHKRTPPHSKVAASYNSVQILASWVKRKEKSGFPSSEHQKWIFDRVVEDSLLHDELYLSTEKQFWQWEQNVRHSENHWTIQAKERWKMLLGQQMSIKGKSLETCAL